MLCAESLSSRSLFLFYFSSSSLALTRRFHSSCSLAPFTAPLPSPPPSSPPFSLSPTARQLLCSVRLNFHHSSVCGVSPGLLIKSEQLMTAFIPHLAAPRLCSCLPVFPQCFAGGAGVVPACVCWSVCRVSLSVVWLPGLGEQMVRYFFPCRERVLQSAASSKICFTAEDFFFFEPSISTCWIGTCHVLCTHHHPSSPNFYTSLHSAAAPRVF